MFLRKYKLVKIIQYNGQSGSFRGSPFYRITELFPSAFLTTRHDDRQHENHQRLAFQLCPLGRFVPGTFCLRTFSMCIVHHSLTPHLHPSSSPLITYPSSLTPHRSPLITHPSSFITQVLSFSPRHSPLVTHPSSLTLHHSPLITRPPSLTPHHSLTLITQPSSPPPSH